MTLVLVACILGNSILSKKSYAIDIYDKEATLNRTTKINISLENKFTDKMTIATIKDKEKIKEFISAALNITPTGYNCCISVHEESNIYTIEYYDNENKIESINLRGIKNNRWEDCPFGITENNRTVNLSKDTKEELAKLIGEYENQKYGSLKCVTKNEDDYYNLEYYDFLDNKIMYYTEYNELNFEKSILDNLYSKYIANGNSLEDIDIWVDKTEITKDNYNEIDYEKSKKIEILAEYDLKKLKDSDFKEYFNIEKNVFINRTIKEIMNEYPEGSCEYTIW